MKEWRKILYYFCWHFHLVKREERNILSAPCSCNVILIRAQLSVSCWIELVLFHSHADSLKVTIQGREQKSPRIEIILLTCYEQKAGSLVITEAEPNIRGKLPFAAGSQRGKYIFVSGWSRAETWGAANSRIPERGPVESQSAWNVSRRDLTKATFTCTVVVRKL